MRAWFPAWRDHIDEGPVRERKSAIAEPTNNGEHRSLAPDVTPSDEQAAAIKSIVDWYRRPDGPQEYYVAGFAGVGKSVTANLAIEELKDQCGVSSVRTAAYTGKAASVLRKKGIWNAQTIHSLIYTPIMDEGTGEVRFVRSEESPAADADLIVLDEVSMVNKLVADDLREYGVRILVLGDPGQLPPISGEGAFTNREPDVFLRQIHRQCEGSPIIHLATLAREGKPWPKGYDKDGVRVLPLNKETQPLIYREETQSICGLNRVRHVYNARIRKMRGFDGDTPQVGERLICRRNNREEGLFNGGMGVLLRIAVKKYKFGDVYEIDVQMDDLADPSLKLLVDPYLFRQNFTAAKCEKLVLPKGFPILDCFDLGYTLTAHVSQGSGWEDVTVIDDSGVFREHAALWRYTCATRAEKSLTILTRD
jgi:exodeoxyribonuclease V